jgi:FSR family fosmidomycin resistance protein-like MFS transporter
MEEFLRGIDRGTKTSKGTGDDVSSVGSNEARMPWVQIIRALGVFGCLAMSMQIVVASVNSYLPLHMVDHHHISPEWAGFVISIIAGAGIVGAPLGGGLSDRLGRKSIIFLSVCLTGPLLLAVTKSPYGILLLFSLMLYGLTMSVRMPTMESLITDVVPVRQRTTVLGIYLFFGVETSGVTTPVVGHLIDTYGSEAVFTALGIGMCLIAAMAWFFRKKI